MEAMRTFELPVDNSRTGIKASPMDCHALERLSSDSPPPPTTESLEATTTRESFTRHADRLGSVPPIATEETHKWRARLGNAALADARYGDGPQGPML